MSLQTIFSRWQVQLASALTLALVLRLLGIFSRPIWYDEAFSILFARQGFAAMLSGTISQTAGVAAEEHPLGYYLLLSGWMTVFGDSLLAARLFSVVSGLGLVVLAYFLVRHLWGARLGWIAALLIACAPFQIHYAQEIRMYVWMTLWLILACYAYWRAHAGTQAWWLLFAFSAALAQYTQHLSGVFLVSLAFYPLLRRDWRTAGRVFLAGLGALLLYLPWLIYLPAQLAKVQTSYWIEPPGFERLFTTLLSFVTNLPIPNDWLAPALFITLLLTSLAVWQTLGAKQSSSLGVWAMYMAFMPAILLYHLSQWTPIFIERALLPSGFMFYIWLAWAFWRAGSSQTLRWLAAGLFLVAASIGLGQHLEYRNFPYAPFEQMDALMRKNSQAGDVIVHSSKLTALPAIYFDSDLPHRYIADYPGGGTDTLALATQKTLGWLASSDLEIATKGASRVWLVIFARSEQEAQAAGLTRHPHLTWMLSHYQLQETYQMDEVFIYLYSKAATVP